MNRSRRTARPEPQKSRSKRSSASSSRIQSLPEAQQSSDQDAGASIGLQETIGNRAVARLFGQREPDPVASVPVTPVINVQLLVDQLTVAIDQEDGERKPMGTGEYMTVRKVQYEKIVAVLDNLTPSQVVHVSNLYDTVNGNPLRDDLLGRGRKDATSLTPAQQGHVLALLRGTVSDPQPVGHQHEFGRTHLDADAAEIPVLIDRVGDDERSKDRLMTMLRRDTMEMSDLARSYGKQFGKELGEDLARLPGPYALQAQLLYTGNRAGADAVAIETKRREVQKLNDILAATHLEVDPGSSFLDRALGEVAGAAKSALGPLQLVESHAQKQRAKLLSEIDAVVDQNRHEVLEEQAQKGVAPDKAKAAVDARINAILSMGDDESNLGQRIRATTGSEVSTDPPIAAARRLKGTAGGPTSAQVAEEERQLRHTAGTEAMMDIKSRAAMIKIDQARTPDEKMAMVGALIGEREGLTQKKAEVFSHRFKDEYNRIRGAGRSFLEILSDTGSETDRKLASSLHGGSGKLTDAQELYFALVSKQPNLDLVQNLLSNKSVDEVDRLGEGYSKLAGKTLQSRFFELPAGDWELVMPLINKRVEAKYGEARQLHDGIRAQYERVTDSGFSGFVNDVNGSETREMLDRTKHDADVAYNNYTHARAIGPYQDAPKYLEELRRLHATMQFDQSAYGESVESTRAKLTSAVTFAVDVAVTVFLPEVKLLQIAASIGSHIAINSIAHGADYSAEMFEQDLIGGLLAAAGSEIGSMGFKAGVSQVTKSVATALEKRGVELGVAMSPGVSAIGRAFSWSGEQIASNQGGSLLSEGKLMSAESTVDAMVQSGAQTGASHVIKHVGSAPKVHDPTGHDPTGRDPTGRDPTGRDPASTDPTTPKPKEPIPGEPSTIGEQPANEHDPRNLEGGEQTGRPHAGGSNRGASTGGGGGVGGGGGTGGTGGGGERKRPSDNHLEKLAANLREQGGWTEAVENPKNPMAAELIARRNELVGELKKHFDPMIPEASRNPGSDVDISFRDGESMIKAREWLAANQPGWGHFKIGLMTDAKRLGMHEELGKALKPEEQQAQQERIDKRADELILARHLRSGRTPELEARLNALGAPERAAVEMLASMDEGRRQVLADEALRQVDGLVKEIETTNDPKEKARLAELASMKQMEANGLGDEAYISNATVEAYVNKREVEIASPGKGPRGTNRSATPTEKIAPRSARQQLQVLQEQRAALQHIIDLNGHDVAKAMSGHEAMKYMNRCIEVLEAAGISTPSMNYLRGISEFVYRADRRANRGPRKEVVVSEGHGKSRARYSDVPDGPMKGMSEPELNAWLQETYDTYDQTVARAEDILAQRAKAAAGGSGPAGPGGGSDSVIIDPSLLGPTVNEPAVPAPPGDHTPAGKAAGPKEGLPTTALSVVTTHTVPGAKNPVRERPLPTNSPVAGSDLPTGNLNKAQFRFRQPLGGGTSKGSLLLTDHQGRKFVFKPAEHESHTGYGGPGETIEAGDRYRRVGAAKIVADALGVRTPEGTSVTLDGVVGSLQKWEPGSVLGDGSKRTEADVRKIQESLDHHDLDIYDFVIANMDRNAGNVLVADDGGLVAIDNDVSFPASNLRYGKVPLENMRPGGKLADWQRKIPPTITAEMAAQMRAMAANEPEMRKKLAAYLDPVEIDGAFHRLDLLLRLMDTKGYPAIE